MAKNKFTLIPMTTPSALSVGTIVTLCSDGQAYLNDKPVARIAKGNEKQIVNYAKRSTDAWFDTSKVAKVCAKVTTQAGLLFGAEAFFVPVRQKKEESNSKKSYTLGGLTAQNPQKTALIKMLQSNPFDEVPLILTLQQFGSIQKMKANFVDKLMSGDSCGEVTDADNELLTFLRNHGSAKAYAQCVEKQKTISILVNLSEESLSQYSSAIDDAISRCIAQAPALEERVAYMVKSQFDEKLIKTVLNSMSEEKGQIPNPQQKYYQPQGNNLADLVSYMMFGKMVRLVGEKGSGKNTLAETACWLLNRPLCRVQGSSELDKMDLLGSRTLKDGSTGFELSSMLETLRDGGVAVIDEANTVRPEVLTILHSLTDGARAIDVPGYGRVEMDKRSCILYTMNEDYIGTGEMNVATIDRGPTLIIEQEVDMGALLKEAVPDAKEEDIQTCCKVSDEIHRIIDQGESEFGSDAVTIRGYIDALQAAMFIPLKRALIQNVANKAQSELERRAISEVIESMIG